MTPTAPANGAAVSSLVPARPAEVEAAVTFAAAPC
jgi:hypothetical protein